MPLSLLFDHFDRLITRPGDLPRLNQTILQLAVQGKLVPQDPADEPASELLKRIRAEKDRLLLTGQLRRDEPLPPIREDETPYELPQSWLWVRLGEATLINMGQSPPSSAYNNVGDGLPFYQGKKDFGEIYPSPTQWCSAPQKIAEEGDVLISVRAPVGPTNICDAKSCIGRGLAAIKPIAGVSNFYLLYTIRAFESNLSGKGVGTTFMAISRKDLEEFLIPLPPLAEQKRIVAKVENLLAQSQALAAELAAAEAEQSRLSRASLHHLLAAPTPADFVPRWHFVASHFEAVTPDPGSVDELKQAILQLAVQGKLVEQDSADEPASELLKCTRAEMIEEGKISPEKLPPPISKNEIPTELPKGWVWCRFPEIGELARGQSKHRPRNAPFLYEDGKYPFVQTGDVARSNGKITKFSAMYGDAGLAQSRMWPKGTLCITIAANIAETGILEFDACFPDSVVGFIPSQIIGSAQYFQYFMRVIKNQLDEAASATAQKNINLGILQSLLIPLPPLAEQKRIVAKVEGLLRQGDELKAVLVAGEAARVKLLESALWGVVNGKEMAHRFDGSHR